MVLSKSEKVATSEKRISLIFPPFVNRRFLLFKLFKVWVPGIDCTDLFLTIKSEKEKFAYEKVIYETREKAWS